MGTFTGFMARSNSKTDLTLYNHECIKCFLTVLPVSFSNNLIFYSVYHSKMRLLSLAFLAATTILPFPLLGLGLIYFVGRCLIVAARIPTSTQHATAILLAFMLYLTIGVTPVPTGSPLAHRETLVKGGYDPRIEFMPEAKGLWDITDAGERELELQRLAALLRDRDLEEGKKAKSENEEEDEGYASATGFGAMTTITVYDCLDHKTSHTPIDLHSPEFCDVRETSYDKPVNVTIQVLQSGGDVIIDGYSCKFTKSTQIARCGYESFGGCLQAF